MKKNKVKTFIYFNPPIDNILYDKRRFKREFSLLEKLAKIPVSDPKCVSRFIEVNLERSMNTRRFTIIEFGRPVNKEDFPYSNILNRNMYILNKKGKPVAIFDYLKQVGNRPPSVVLRFIDLTKRTC